MTRLHSLNPYIKCRVNRKVHHQKIGGKHIIIFGYITVGELCETDFKEMTIAAYNFINRRPDLVLNLSSKYDDVKIYYGHVGDLGYFVSEDELVFGNWFTNLFKKKGVK